MNLNNYNSDELREIEAAFHKLAECARLKRIEHKHIQENATTAAYMCSKKLNEIYPQLPRWALNIINPLHKTKEMMLEEDVKEILNKKTSKDYDWIVDVAPQETYLDIHLELKNTQYVSLFIHDTIFPLNSTAEEILKDLEKYWKEHKLNPYLKE